VSLLHSPALQLMHLRTKETTNGTTHGMER